MAIRYVYNIVPKIANGEKVWILMYITKLQLFGYFLYLFEITGMNK
jgi:hypothetical protein